MNGSTVARDGLCLFRGRSRPLLEREGQYNWVREKQAQLSLCCQSIEPPNTSVGQVDSERRIYPFYTYLAIAIVHLVFNGGFR
jgi:hypothetical protein